MNVYQVGQQTFCLIDGQLYLKLEPVQPLEVVEERRPNKKRLGRPRQSKLVDKNKASRSKYSPELQAKILSEHFKGASIADLAKKYGVVAGNIYVWKSRAGNSRKHREDQVNDIHGYRCASCGKTFKSVLPKLDALCPMPTCTNPLNVIEIPVEEVV